MSGVQYLCPANYFCVDTEDKMCKTEPPEMILSWSCYCQLMETHHVEKFPTFSIANLDSTWCAVTVITRAGSEVNKHPDWISSSLLSLTCKENPFRSYTAPYNSPGWEDDPFSWHVGPWRILPPIQRSMLCCRCWLVSTSSVCRLWRPGTERLSVRLQHLFVFTWSLLLL